MATILIVDDASFTRQAIKTVLETAGHTIVGFAINGDEAVAQYTDLKPDVVTMDILMAGKDGLAALHDILQTDPNAKVVMVSVLARQDTIEDAGAAGAKGYIIKPFKPVDLVQAVAEALK